MVFSIRNIFCAIAYFSARECREVAEEEIDYVPGRAYVLRESGEMIRAGCVYFA